MHSEVCSYSRIFDCKTNGGEMSLNVTFLNKLLVLPVYHGGKTDQITSDPSEVIGYYNFVVSQFFVTSRESGIIV